MSIVVWHEGRIVGPAEPLVSATDHGLTVGDGSNDFFAQIFT